MDPNLEKIKEANIEDIKSGKLGRVISQAASYLTIMLDNDFYKIDRELSEFKKEILEIKEQHHGSIRQASKDKTNLESKYRTSQAKQS